MKVLDLWHNHRILPTCQGTDCATFSFLGLEVLPVNLVVVPDQETFKFAGYL